MCVCVCVHGVKIPFLFKDFEDCSDFQSVCVRDLEFRESHVTLRDFVCVLSVVLFILSNSQCYILQFSNLKERETRSKKKRTQ